MHGLEGFSDIIKNNASSIFESLTSQDKEKLFALLPKPEQKPSGKYVSMTDSE